MLDIGILVFDEVEELDFVGPWEVFGMANRTAAAHGQADFCTLRLVAEHAGHPVTCAKGLKVLPDITTEDCNGLDVLVVPGGAGARREVYNRPLLNWIAEIAENAQWVTSVCTGALLLCAAGPGRGRKVTTHWSFVEPLRARGEAAEVLSDVRYVQDGNLITAAGVSAGIDMSLWLVGQLESPDFARDVERAMQYAPEPPYQA